MSQTSAAGPATYPPDWKAIAQRIKDQAGWSCERCKEPHRREGAFVLTVHLVRCVEISIQLKENLAVFKRLHGDRWPELMADMGTALQLQMKATGETNPIVAAIPVAKAMSRDNQNPLLLLAVATDLAQALNDKIRHDADSAAPQPKEQSHE
jgi:hypothetical protein